MDGRAHRAYHRAQAALERRCSQEPALRARVREGCGKLIDTSIPDGQRMSFSNDPQCLSDGGRLVGQQLVPIHLSRNSRRGNNAPV